MITRFAAFLALVLLVPSCSGGGGGGGGGSESGTGALTLFATDDPFAFEFVTEARISVPKITIHGDDESDSGFITVYSGRPIELNLLDLRNGVTQQLAQAELPEGDYGQLRIYVSDATLTLNNGNVYSMANSTLKLTSQATSGFKCNIDPPVHIGPAVDQELLLDFDLSKTFHPVPANDPLNASTYKLMPVIHVSNVTETGEIRGLVTQDDGAGNQIPVADATVHILPPGEPDPLNSIATTGTLPDGTYAVLGLEAGLYDVLATKETLQGRVNGVSVSIGAATVVDIVIQ